MVLRGWSLTFIFLATLLVFSVVDGRMAYVHGPYTGFIGLWIDCRRHKCVNVGQFTVCRRLKTIDFIFSFLSIVIGTLSFLNQVRTWSYSIPSMERRLSYFRWASRHHSLHLQQQTIMDRNLESVQKLSAVTSFVNSHGALQQSDSSTTQGTDESPWPDSSTSVPVAQFRSDLP